MLPVLAVGLVALTASGAPRKHVIVDGSRARPVHLIPLYDEHGDDIRPNFDSPMPFSTRQTCGDCHDYDKIKMGWHFNSSSGVTKPGRPGEPWVLADESACVQLPVSYRGWPGTWLPADAGLTQWEFVKRFGHHMPGGDMGEPDDPEPDPKSRWNISGKLDINCLACHEVSANHSQSEWAVQVGRENFRWAATAASQLGVVRYMASRLPDSYDLINGPNLDNSYASVPEVAYNASRFNDKGNVFFDVTCEVPVDRCYYCHSTISEDLNGGNRWQWDADIHVAAGLKCVDCHRNGLDHSITRGYEGERDDSAHATLTCEGCHLGTNTDAGRSMGGRLRAPRPQHRGFPAVHLQKLTCTACHSGFMPKDEVGRVRTARSNRLGIHGRAQWDTKVPHILSPVFIRQEDGKIAPHEMMWPAFWGRMKGDKVTALSMDVVSPVVEALREAEKQAKLEVERQREAAMTPPPQGTQTAVPAPPQEEKKEPAAKPDEPSGSSEAQSGEGAPKSEAPKQERSLIDVRDGSPPIPGECVPGTVAPPEEPIPSDENPPLTEAQVVKVLTELAKTPGDGAVVYVTGGKVYRLAENGNSLVASDNPVAQPYSWPLAHDVRPASESLGSGGCSDCHADEAPFFYGKVVADCPAPVGTPVTASMYQYEGLDPSLLEALDEVSTFRLAFIIGCIVMAVILVAALFHYGILGLEGLLRLLVAQNKKP